MRENACLIKSYIRIDHIMIFKYCPDCGAKLTSQDLGDDKDVPWCGHCAKPWFPVFPVAMIALVYDYEGNVLLLRQNYISEKFCNLVSGYLIPGESAEECAVREIYEEAGLIVEKLTPVTTNWFAKKDMLMVGYFAKVGNAPLKLSTEVDDAFWCSKEKILDFLSDKPYSTSRLLAREFLRLAELS